MFVCRLKEVGVTGEAFLVHGEERVGVVLADSDHAKYLCVESRIAPSIPPPNRRMLTPPVPISRSQSTKDLTPLLTLFTDPPIALRKPPAPSSRLMVG